MLKNFFFVTVLFTSSLFANDIVITNAYVRAVPPNLSNSASFMQITNRSSKTISLLSVDSNVAKNVELHEHVMNNGMMKMQQIQSIKIPANSTVELKPGGLHVMLIGLNKKLVEGEKVESFTFNFSDKTSITVDNILVKSVMMGMKHK
jgi:copper(I)-binding protein